MVEKVLEAECLTALHAHLADANLPIEVQKQIVLMLDSYLPGKTEFAEGSMDADEVATLMRDRVKATAIVAEYTDEATLDAYAELLAATLEPLLAPKTQQEANEAQLLKRANEIKEQNDELLAIAKKSGQFERLRDEGITQKAIIRLAQRITAETNDLGQAWLELQNAMDIAVRVQTEGQVQSNHGDFVDTVLKRVAALSRDGEYTTASDEIDEALDQADAQVIRLLDSGIEVALLDRNTAKAAALLVRKADMDAGGVAEFEALRALRRHYYEIGRDKGRNLDSALAIDLARLVLDRANTPDERGTAGNDLGIALRTLGERHSDTVRLEQAVTVYTEALEENTRDRMPMHWATTQMNLGNALLSLGQRDSDTARLEQAVNAYTEALEENTRDRVPMEWAKTQMNLGIALKTLGQRDSDTARLEQAVTTYTEALKENTRDRVPMDWAMTQHCLAGANISFFDKSKDPAHLDRAMKHANLAREVYVQAQAEYFINWIDTQQIAAIQSRRDALEA